MTTPPFTIRPYRDEDLPLLRAMTVEAFQGVSIDQNIEREFGPKAVAAKYRALYDHVRELP